MREHCVMIPVFDNSEIAQLTTEYGIFNVQAYEDIQSGQTHCVLWMGQIATNEPLLVRHQSACITGTAFASIRCDCSDQIEAALLSVAKLGRGLLLYMDEEGRGHGLREKITALHHMNRGMDTVSSLEEMGKCADARDFSLAAVLLRRLHVPQAITLLTNNPFKVAALSAAGFEIARRPIVVARNAGICGYLQTKRDKLGHIIEGL
jgi:GTP cyclohydrolase II